MRRMWSVVRYVSKEAVFSGYRRGSGWRQSLLEMPDSGHAGDGKDRDFSRSQASDTGSVPGMVAPGVRRHHNG